MKELKPALVRQLFVLLLIIFLLVIIFREILPYLSGVLGAITLYVILNNWMTKLVARGWKPTIAAAMLMTGSFVGILVPVTLIVLLLSSKVGKVVVNAERVINAIETKIEDLEVFLGYDISGNINTGDFTNWISKNVQDIAGGTFDAFIAIGIMYFMLYYMLVHRRQFRRMLISYIPLDKENLRIIGKESNALVKSNALGIPLVAIFQGVVAIIGYFIFGAPDPFFWFVITTVGSVVPFVGSALGILPVAFLLLSQGQNWEGIGILIYGFAVVGVTDNLVRLYVLKKLDNVHPLITLFGVIVGVPLFGFIGLIFGPLLISLFLLIIKIYKKEYGEKRDLETLKINER